MGYSIGGIFISIPASVFKLFIAFIIVLLTIGSWATIIPGGDSNDADIGDVIPKDEPANSPPAYDSKQVAASTDDNDYFEVYEIMYPENEDDFSDEYYETVRTIQERNLANGWNNAGPAWYNTPRWDGNDFKLPLTGTRATPKPAPPKDRLLVIFINFTDSGSDVNHDPNNRDTKYFNESVIFNQSAGANTLYNYYQEISYNSYSITGKCAKNSSNTNGWYTANNTEAYFGMYEMYSSPPNGYGNAKDLVAQAVALADPAINFTEFDSNGDAFVDHLMVVHAGLDDAADGGGGPEGDPQIWSHRGGIAMSTNDGPLIWGYTMLAEKSLMGVFAHEYGHDLGLWDLYNTSKGGQDIVKEWDVMAGGAYNTYGGKNKPSHMSSWNKEYLGWLNPITINESNNNQGIKTVRAMSLPTNENTSFKVNLPGSNESFYVENRWRNTSSFDAGLPDSGILIWHIDEDKPGNFVTPGVWNIENANPLQPTLADAAWAAEDNQIIFNVTTTPNTNYNNGTNTTIQMDMINNSGSHQRIRILLSGDPFPPKAPVINSVLDAPKDNGHEVLLNWTRSADDGLGDDDVRFYNIYLNDTGQGATGTKHIIKVITGDDQPFYEVKVGGLIDKVIYYFAVTADDGPNEGGFSNNVSGVAYDNIASPPTGLLAVDTANDDGEQITLTWTVSADDALDIVGYNVSINDTGQGAGGAKHIITTLGPGNNSFTISNLINGVTYYFNVSAFDEVYNLGFSNEASAQPADDSVGFPTGLTSDPPTWTSTNSFKLTWSNPVDKAGISGAYYKLDTYPLNSTDGDFVAGAAITQLNVSVVGSGVHAVYVWLVDGVGNKDHTKWDRTYLYYDGNEPDRPKGVVANPGSWTSVNSFDVNWTNPADLTYISGVYYKLDTMPTSDTDGTFIAQTNITNLNGISVTGDADVHKLWLWLSDGMMSANYKNSTTVNLYYDSTPPAQPNNISVSPDMWSNTNNFDVTWDNPDSPPDLSGVVGAYYKLNDPPNSATDGYFFPGTDISAINGISVGTEGVHDIYVWLIDNASNIDHLNAASIKVYYDITPPDPPENIKVEPSSWTQENTFSFNWTNPKELSGVNGVYYKIGSIPTHDRDGIYIEGKDIDNLTDIVIDKEGSYVVYLWLNDTAGNVDNKYNNKTFIHRDITAPGKPRQFFITPDSWTNENNFSVRWVNPVDLSGISGVYFKLDSPPTSNTDGNFLKGSNIKELKGLTVAGHGQHTLYVWLTDNANNTDFNNYNTTTLKFDEKPPGAPNNILVSPTYWSSENSFTVTWDNPVDDSGIGGAYYKVGSPPTGPADGDYLAGIGITELKGLRAVTDGVYDIFVWLKDGAGNFDNLANSSVTIYYDNEPPSVRHTKIEAWTKYVTINVYAVIEDVNANVRAAYVFYKTDSDFNYYSIPMIQKGTSYEAQIPSHKASGNSLSYFIMALDNSEPANRIYFGNYGETYTNITAANDIDIALTDEDLAPPLISHKPVNTGTEGKSITLTALVSDDASGISEVVLHYRNSNVDNYRTKTIVKKDGYYIVTIEPEQVTLSGVS